MTIAPAPALGVLSDEMLERFAARAAGYDAENLFFAEDFEELRDCGYLQMAVPVERGGLGATLAQACREQRRLARRAPATALGVSMHLYWTGLAADLYRAGDRSLAWILDEAVAGEVFAVGRGERGTDMPLLGPLTRAERTEGGYRFSGHKIFGSMSPVWTRLAVEGMDMSDPAAPRVVHAFLPREASGYSIIETWDAMGMRATRSDDTLLSDAFIPDRYVARIVPAGWSGMDAFVTGIQAWGLCLIASVYVGIAERACELAVDGCQHRTSAALGGRTLAHHPMLQHSVAEMVMECESAAAIVDRAADDWSAGIEHGVWVAKLAAAKHRATEGAQRVVGLALEVSGGTGMARGHELERLYRDVRCGPFHPPNPALTHELVGKAALGLLAQEPRW